MIEQKIKFSTIFSLIGICVFLLNCTSTKVASYDKYSYERAVDLKTKMIRIMDKATEPYTLHKNRAEGLLVEIREMAQYEGGKANNETSSKMWEMLGDESKPFVGGFINRWKEKGQFSPLFVEEAKLQALEAMNLLIDFELKKDAQTKNSLQTLILESQ
ncbi:hypothetical protein ACOKFD_08060 [Flagellimonas sp. S174]|uniref:hypothetical protein n=1 Tax=Flagellimonas sp. S174 TaxID=3410790 RepID=UPI003BF4DF5A